MSEDLFVHVKDLFVEARAEKAPAIAGRGKLAERSEKQGIRPCPLYTLVSPNIP